MSDIEIFNAAEYFIDRNVRAGRGDKPAFVEGTRVMTYGELQSEAARMGGLLERFGIRREERVAMITLDTLEFPIIFLGSIRAGVIPVALNTLLSTEQYRYMLTDSRAQALFVSAPLLPVVSSILGDIDTLKHVFVIGEAADADGLHDFTTELAQSETAPIAETNKDEVAFWLYSSGSTGMPKGVQHVHTSPVETAKLFGDDLMHITENDVIFSAAKLFFAYGLGNGLSFPMHAGATTVLLPGRPTPDSVFSTLSSHKPTIFCGVPTLYAAMLAHPGCGPQLGSPNLRICLSAGEALPEDVGRRWSSLFGVDIVDGVGSTEMLHIFLSNRPEEIAYGTSGKPVPGYEVRLVDETNEDVDDGEVGELLVNGTTAAVGYWNQREKSRRTFEGVWTRTGDKYIRDADGYFTYCGRTDDMFKVSGIWVSPFEIESALVSHPSVLEAAVVPREDDDELVKPCAYVVAKDGAELDFNELKEHVKSAIGKWKYPRWIEAVDELPKTATGKIQRFKLRVR